MKLNVDDTETRALNKLAANAAFNRLRNGPQSQLEGTIGELRAEYAKIAEAIATDNRLTEEVKAEIIRNREAEVNSLVQADLDAFTGLGPSEEEAIKARYEAKRRELELAGELTKEAKKQLALGEQLALSEIARQSITVQGTFSGNLASQQLSVASNQDELSLLKEQVSGINKVAKGVDKLNKKPGSLFG